MTGESPFSDPTGKKTLEVFSKAIHFNKWMFNKLAPYFHGHILEIGSGIGNISSLLLEQYVHVNLSDVKYEYCKILQSKFSGNSNLENIYQLNLEDTSLLNHFPELKKKFDTVLVLNVVEHIKDDKQAINNCKKFLNENGTLIILVPAHQFLYNSIDKELGHFKRYDQKSISSLLGSCGLTVIHTSYFNTAGIPAWWLSGSILRKKMVTGSQMRIYDRLIPLFKLADIIFNKVSGLSVIAIAQKI
ncbi:MAG: class I SAM-dependent methyltransferase [Chitinophagaceae bacterium]|nr:class I SAM-dependent methyltransferase [Chitinophagaceae bacterium]MCW5928528.1 class I SAM-dependent methyltransferase [Chitinophagaceae bacterium]